MTNFLIVKMQRRFKQGPTRLGRSFAQDRFGMWINYGLIMKDLRIGIEKLQSKAFAKNEFTEQMGKLLLRQDKLETMRSELKGSTEGGVFLSDQPVYLILKEVQRIVTEVGYSDELVADAFELIASVQAMRGPNTSVASDLNNLDLFYDHRWENLIQLLEYGLTPGHYMSSKSIERILKALTKLGYKDIKLQRKVQDKLQTNRYLPIFRKRDSLDIENMTPEEISRLPLANKKNFYTAERLDILDLHTSKRFNKYLDYLLKSKKSDSDPIGIEAKPASQSIDKLDYRKLADYGLPQEAIQQAQNMFLQDQQDSDKPANQIAEAVGETNEQTNTPEASPEVNTEELNEIDDKIQQLAQVFKESRGSLIKLTHSILTLRNNYQSLTQIQKLEFINENASLMADLMEVEELMIEMGLISVSDIKKVDKENHINNDYKKIGPLIRQMTYEFGGNASLVEDLQHFYKEEGQTQELSVNSETGIYKDGYFSALAALADYSIMNARDIDLDSTYTDPTLAELVNPQHFKEKFIYSNEKYPLESLRALYADPIVDRKAISTASPIYFQSLKEFGDLVSAVTQRPGVLLTITQSNILERAKLLYAVMVSGNRHLLDSLLYKAEANIDIHASQAKFTELFGLMMKLPLNCEFTRGLFSKEPFLLSCIQRSLTEYFETKPEEKIDMLYQLALISSSKKSIATVFSGLMGEVATRPGEFEELCCNLGNYWLPLPENARKLFIIYMRAKSLGMKIPPAFDELYQKIAMAKAATFGYEDNSHPLYLGVKDSIRNVFHKSVDPKSSLDLPIPDALKPDAQIPTSFDYEIFLYVRDERSYCYNTTKMNKECQLESYLMQEYFSKTLGRNIKVINMPYKLLINPPKTGQVTDEYIESTFKSIHIALHTFKITDSDKFDMMRLINKTSEESSEKSQSEEPWKSLNSLMTHYREDINWFQERPNVKLDRAMKELHSSYISAVENQYKSGESYALQLEKVKRSLLGLAKLLPRDGNHNIPAFKKKFGSNQSAAVYSRLQNIAKTVDSLASSAKANMSNLPIFAGRRRGLDMLSSEHQSNENNVPTAIEFFNYELLRSPNFYNYADWKNEAQSLGILYSRLDQLCDQRVSTNFGTANLGLVPSNISGFEFMMPLGNSLFWETNDLQIAPEASNNKRQIDQIGLSLNSETFTPEIRMRLALEKFKYHLKFSNDLEEDMRTILSLDLIKLMLQHHVTSLVDSMNSDSQSQPNKINSQNKSKYILESEINRIGGGEKSSETEESDRLRGRMTWFENMEKQIISKYGMTGSELVSQHPEYLSDNKLSGELKLYLQVFTEPNSQLAQEFYTVNNARSTDNPYLNFGYNTKSQTSTQSTSQAPNRVLYEVTRDPQSYLDYIKGLKRPSQAHSQYSQFTKNQRAKVEELNKWRTALYNHMPQLYKKAKKSRTSLKSFYSMMSFTKKKYLQALRDVYDQVRDTHGAFSNYSIRQKIVSLPPEQEFKEEAGFDMEKDAEFRSVGNPSSYLELRKSMAQTKVIKTLIIYKLTNDFPLNQNEKFFLEFWSQLLFAGKPNDIIPSRMFVESYSSLTPEDLKALTKLGFDIDSDRFADYSCTDFIFELSEMFNQRIIDHFENSIIERDVSPDFYVESGSAIMRGGYYSNRKKQLLDTIEEREWQTSLMFTPEDISNICELMGIGRGTSKNDRQKWEIDRRSLLEFIKSINGHDDRWELLFTWIERKAKEVKRRPQSVVQPLLKTDSELANVIKDKASMQKYKHLCEIFQKEASQITEEELSQFCQATMKRMYVLSKFLPPTLLNVLNEVLSHPSLKLVDRNSLLESLRLFKIDLTSFRNEDPLYLKPVVPYTSQNPLLNDQSLEDPETLKHQFHQADFNLGSFFLNKLNNLIL